jgi:hypothetical protein
MGTASPVPHPERPGTRTSNVPLRFYHARCLCLCLCLSLSGDLSLRLSVSVSVSFLLCLTSSSASVSGSCRPPAAGQVITPMVNEFGPGRSRHLPQGWTTRCISSSVRMFCAYSPSAVFFVFILFLCFPLTRPRLCSRRLSLESHSYLAILC